MHARDVETGLMAIERQHAGELIKWLKNWRRKLLTAGTQYIYIFI